MYKGFFITCSNKSIMYTSTTQIRVRYGETDQMGYLYYGYYALYYEQGRTEAIRQLGFTYKELEAQGVIMPVIELNAKYHRPALYDDLITVKTSIKTLDNKQTDIAFYSELYNEAGKLLNEAVVTLVFYNPKVFKRIAIPEVLYNKLIPYF